MISKSLNLLDKSFKCIIAYADTTFEHDGTIYKASNFVHDKIVKSDYWYVKDDKWIMHKKTLYNRAMKVHMIESEFAQKFGYIKVFGKEKYRFKRIR